LQKKQQQGQGHGVTSLYIRTRAKTGSLVLAGVHAAGKSLSKEGLKILSILDVTRVPEGDQRRKEERGEEEYN